MREPRVVICTLALGGWYPKGVARMIERFEQASPGFEIQAWVNRLPPGAPEQVDEEGVNYTAYCAKPFVLKAAMESGADIVLMLDASIYPLRHIQAVVEHIARFGYVLAAAGFRIGQWANDRALGAFDIDREMALLWADCLSGFVGLDVRRSDCRQLIRDWCESWPTFLGRHSNVHAETKEYSYRNEGFVSHDPRVLGHRHDQTALSILAHRYGFNQFVQMPKFIAYPGKATDETILMVQGIG